MLALAASALANIYIFQKRVAQPLDEVSLYAHVVSSGRTSIRVHVEAWKRARTHPANASVRVTQGVFTYVAIDQDRKPRPLPGRD